MISMTSLWLPILLSAVVVFLASAVIHMALKLHKNDYAGLPGEAKVLEAMQSHKVQPGEYFFPYAADCDMSKPEMQDKFKRGPVGMMTVMPSGPINMGKNLGQWFAFCVVVGVVVAYMTSRTLGAGTDYLQVFRVAGTIAFVAYAGGEPIQSIWRGRRWGLTVKHMLDGLVYALLTGGVFGWLWPH